jgi:hypothetical protein
MERSWMDTIQLLGLDVQLAIVAVMWVLIAATDLLRSAQASMLRRLGSGTATPRRRALAYVPPVDSDPWPPQEWRPSH